MRKRLAILGVALLALLLVGGFFAVKRYTRRMAERKVQAAVSRLPGKMKVKFDDMDVRIARPGLALRNTSFTLPGGRMCRVSEIVVDRVDITHRRPHYATAKLTGATLDVTRANFGSLAEPLRALGYDRLRADVDVSYDYDAGKRTMTVSRLDIRADGIGDLAVRGRLGGFVLEEVLRGRYEPLVIESLDIEYRDRSFFERLLAQAQQKDPAFMEYAAQELARDAFGRGSDSGGRSLAELVKLVRDPAPPTLRVALREPTSIGAFSSQHRLSRFLDLLNIELDSESRGARSGSREAAEPILQKLIHYRPPSGTTVYARDGSVLGRFMREKRVPVRAADLPYQVTRAFLAAEDSAFYEHEGVDPTAIFRALSKNLEAGGIVQGGSTITQQVVKQLLLSSEKTYMRKLKEAFLAYRLEKTLGKDEILNIYFNEVFFGSNAYGLEAAAQTYFGKRAADLTLAECALLAGLPRAPSAYNPYRDAGAARERQRYVLNRMLGLGWISSSEHEAALSQPLEYRSAQGGPGATVGAYYLEEVRRWLIENLSEEKMRERGMELDRYGEDAVYGAGLEVYTAVDLRHQNAAEQALREGLAESAGEGGVAAAPVRGTASYDPQVPPTGDGETHIEPGQRVQAVVVETETYGVSVRVQDSPGTIYYRDMGEPRPALSPGDTVWATVVTTPWAHEGLTLRLDSQPEPLRYTGLQGALVSMDPTTGDVLALVGGYDFQTSQFNRATQARRQPGSAFKPIVYSAALDAGFTAGSVIHDEPQTFVDAETGKEWSPRNYGGKYYGPTLLRTALVKSRNNVTVLLAKAVGLRNVISRARRMGIEGDIPYDLSVSLGSLSIAPINLCQAYTTFARGGSSVKPRLVLSVRDSLGRDLYTAPIEASEAVTPQNAFVITTLLKEVIQRGTATVCRELGRPAAGKTGTTNDLKDAWFIGFTPYLLSGVWVGYDDNRPMGPEDTGGRVAAPIWLRYRLAVESDYPEQDFPRPPGIVFKNVMVPSGEDDSRLPPTYSLPFIAGAEAGEATEARAARPRAREGDRR